MHRERMTQLIEKMESGHASPAEIAELDRLYEEFESKPDLTQGLSPEAKDQLKNRLYAKIRARTGQPKGQPKGQVRYLRQWVRAGAAAVAFAAIGLAIYFQLNRDIPSPASLSTTGTAVVPGQPRATLTLSDGTEIELDSTQNGIVMADGMIVYGNGQLVANTDLPENPPSDPSAGSGESLLKLTVPRGGMYNIELSDGSKVWLNAGSTLTYPSRFSQDSRTVKLRGEAYFEIAQRSAKDGGRIPFFIESGRQITEVLGTAFNISAYEDEPEIRTTLVRGAVQIHFTTTATADENGHSPTPANSPRVRRIVLQPNEQSVLGEHGIDVRQVDVNNALAWKNGYFIFNNEKLSDILKKISRWYDVDIRYEDDVSQVALIGIIPRSENIETVLNSLEKTGEARFKLKERRIHVTK